MSSESQTQTVAQSGKPLAVGTIRREDFEIVARMLSSLTDDVKFHLTADGIHTQPMDAAAVALLDIDVSFSEWEYNDADEETVIGVDVNESLREPMDVLRKMDVEEFTVVFTEDEITYETDVGYNASFETVDSDSIRHEPDLPALEYGPEIRIDFADMYEWFTTLKKYSHAYFKTDLHGFTIETDTDHAVMSKTWKQTGLRDHASYYSIDYLYGLCKSLLKGHANRFEVVIQFDDEYPVTMDFVGNAGGLDITYIVAPRIAPN